MTDRELVDALRSTTSRSKRKLLDAAADRIESTIRVRTTIDDETIYGFPVRDLVVAATVMRRSGIEPEDLRKLCYNLDFAFNVAREELEKMIERAMPESRERSKNDRKRLDNSRPPQRKCEAKGACAGVDFG